MILKVTLKKRYSYFKNLYYTVGSPIMNKSGPVVPPYKEQ